MSKENITFRLDTEKRAALDAIAASLDRDRSYVLTEAVESYIEVHQWQIERIRKAVAEADAGQFASEDQVNTFFEKWAGGSDED
jgi:predicted transcriptional regulator